MIKFYEKKVEVETVKKFAEFEIGEKYFARSICDSNCIFEIKVLKKSAKMVTYDYDGRVRRSVIRTEENGEYIQPDNYSFAPIFRAIRKFN